MRMSTASSRNAAEMFVGPACGDPLLEYPRARTETLPPSECPVAPIRLASSCVPAAEAPAPRAHSMTGLMNSSVSTPRGVIVSQ